MTTAALLLREIETMPEETAVQVLDFAKFLKASILRRSQLRQPI
jgi:hypothetical protein